jgi:hypothetical protein
VLANLLLVTIMFDWVVETLTNGRCFYLFHMLPLRIT